MSWLSEWGDKAGDALDHAAGEVAGGASGNAPDVLAFTTCTEAAVQVAEAAAEVAAGVAEIIASHGAAAGEALPQVSKGTLTILQASMTELATRTNKYLWAGYLLAAANSHQLVASAADPGGWYRVTHNGCGGPRTTGGSAQRDMARAMGIYLATPALGITLEELDSFHGVLLSQGMDGLEPVWPTILSGFRGAVPAGAPAPGAPAAAKGGAGLLALLGLLFFL